MAIDVSSCVCRVNRAEENENKLWLVGERVCMCASVCMPMPPPSIPPSPSLPPFLPPGLLICTIVFYFLTTFGIVLLYAFFINWSVSGKLREEGRGERKGR